MWRRNALASVGLGMLLLFGPPASGAERASRSKLAVLDLKDNGVGPEVASLLTGVACNKLASFGIFEVISREDIRNLLTHEQDQQLLGCVDDECMVKLGGALGAENLVAGSVGMVGKQYVISLQLLDVSKARVAKRVQREVSGTREQLLDEVANAAHQVVEDILKAEGGTLLVSASEEGADVAVDGRTVGTTPVAAIPIPAGPHDLRISKKSFIDWVRTVQVRPHEVQVVEVSQVPSAKFIEDYESRSGSLRRWAWITAAAFVAFEGTAAGLRTYTWQTYDPIEHNYNTHNYGGMTQDGYYQRYKDDMKKAEAMDYSALGLCITGVLAGVASLVLFLEGDDPGRYQKFRAVKGPLPESSSAVTPSAGIGNFSLSWTF